MDAHVGKYILEECLVGQLKTKTRILVTHKIESLKYVDRVFIFKGGKIVAEGDSETIKASSYYQEIEEKSTKKPQMANSDESPKPRGEGRGRGGRGGRGGGRGGGMMGMGRGDMDMGMSMGMSTSTSSMAESQSPTQKPTPGGVPKKSSVYEKEEQKQLYDKLMLNEDRNVGAVGLKTWRIFFSYFGNTQFFIFLMSGKLIILLFLVDLYKSYCSLDFAQDIFRLLACLLDPGCHPRPSSTRKLLLFQYLCAFGHHLWTVDLPQNQICVL